MSINRFKQVARGLNWSKDLLKGSWETAAYVMGSPVRVPELPRLIRSFDSKNEFSCSILAPA